MSTSELFTRLRQEVHKRLDYAGHFANLAHKSQARYDRLGIKTGNFFFLESELPALCKVLKETLPGEVAKLTREADNICAHRFNLLGHRDLEYGPEIDWHLDAVHSVTAPLKPWFKVRFLDFSTVGDHKVIWELNRHQHLVVLAKAFVLTSNERYVIELVSQWYNWQVANPYPLGINWASSLEVAFRSLSWLWVRALLADCSAVPTSFHHDLDNALELNGRHIYRYLSTYFSPNTHLLGEALALFVIGTLCPWIPTSHKWATAGWQILQQQIEHQVRSDGTYFEQSLYYHVYALDLFLHARILAERNGIAASRTMDDKLQQMLQFVLAVSQGAPPDCIGDDDGGRVFDPRRNQSSNLTDPLVIGAVLFGRSDLRSGLELTEEAVWLFASEAVREFDKESGPATLRSFAFPSAGVYITASSEGCSERLIIDGGTMGAGRGGHGHADALSLTYSMDGRNWLVDSGTMSYSLAKQRDRFRGTAAHNTLRVDGTDQAEATGPFAWRHLPDVQTTRWLSGKTFTFFHGMHNGYCRLADPVFHHRFVFHSHGGLSFVRDLLEGTQEHSLECNWHFAPGLRVDEVEGSWTASPICPSNYNRPRLAVAMTPGWKCKLTEAAVSGVYGDQQAAPLLIVTRTEVLPLELGTVLRPVLHPLDESARLIMTQHRRSLCTFQFDERGQSHCIFFSDGEPEWSVGEWSSDAEFVYVRSQSGSIVHLVFCNGSFLKLGGKPVVEHYHTIATFEWTSTCVQPAISAPDDIVSNFFPDALQHFSVIL